MGIFSSLFGNDTKIDTSGMEDLYQQALDYAIQQDQWNRQFAQTQADWAAQDRERQLELNALDRSMYYSMLGQDRGYAADAYDFNKSQAALGASMAQAAMNYNMGANEQDRALFEANMAAQQASVDRANQMAQQEWAWNQGNIEADRAYWAAHMQPLLEQMAADASPTALQYSTAAGQAAADVAGAYDKQLGIQRREAARYGIDPMSGRYASANRAFDLSRAASEAGAMSNARGGVQNRADANRAAALQMGQTYRNTQILNPNHYQTYAMASYKSNPLGYYNPQSVGYNAPLGTPNTYAGYGLPDAFKSSAAGIAQGYGNALGDAAGAQVDANAAESSGLFGAIGTGVGLWRSSRRFKRDIAPLGAQEALESLRAVTPVRYRYNPGMGPQTERWGAIAEQVPERFTNPERDALDMQNLVGALVAAVRGMAERIEALERKSPQPLADAA